MGKAGVSSLDYFPLTHHFRVMEQHSASAGFTLPDECRRVAEALFPAGGGVPARSFAAVADFAEALGIGTEYRRFLKAVKNNSETVMFLGHFRSNLDLLIRKTWVEQADEERKEQLRGKIEPFMAMVVQGDFRRAAGELCRITNELAYLLFGGDSTGSDFAEYIFRVNTQLGLFWWYASRLGIFDSGAAGFDDDEFLWALLLIGICYLANF